MVKVEADLDTSMEFAAIADVFSRFEQEEGNAKNGICGNSGDNGSGVIGQSILGIKNTYMVVSMHDDIPP